MLRKKMVIVFGLILGLVMVVPLIVLINQSPVLIRIPNPDSVRGTPLFLVLNPLRDKEHEKAADSFFEKLKNGKCLEATADLSADKSNQICRKQTEYPLKEWNLVDMKRENNSFELMYKHLSGNQSMSEDMTIWTEKREQEYQVKEFVIIY